MNIHNKAKILKLLGKSIVLTTSEVASELKISWNTAEKLMLELTIEEEVKRIRKAGVNLWLKR
jgi:Mn-dependent DtxR family transcriptional regulator